MVKIHHCTLQGLRPSNEDEHVIFQNIDNFNKDYNPIDIIGVFDGHGGKLVSKFAKDNLASYFIKKNNKLFVDSHYTSKYINKAFLAFNKELKKAHPRASYHSGSTCCLGIICKDSKGYILWVINAGDSRMVLHNKEDKAVQLSFDHKPNEKNERKRIESIDGGKEKIYYDGCDWRVDTLSLSRALGDLDVAPYVSNLPHVYRYRINKDDKNIIVACDGVWDVMKNQKVVDLLKNKQKNPAKYIANQALKEGSTDNVTVIVYDLLN